jgi:two-component system, cell cycle response regulator DivK
MDDGVTKQKILIVEDDASNFELVRDLLTIAGYETVGASSAEEGVVLSRTKSPDLVLMDLSLPGMDGLTATRLLKSDPRTRHIPVVAVTAHAVDGTEDAARDAGCCSYIAKPIDTRRFAGLIDETFVAEAYRKATDAESGLA